MDNLAGIIVCARVRSSRIPEKVLSDIGGRRAIDILLTRAKSTGMPVTLAIPSNHADDILEEIGNTQGVTVYRGQDDSPLHRMVEANKKSGYEHIIRVTADDILLDSFMVERQLEYHLRSQADYTFLRDCPDACASEIIRASKLQAIAETHKQPIEFTSYYLKGADWKVERYVPPREYRKRYRLTMDYPEDLTVLRILHNQLHGQFGALDIINFMRDPANWYITKINRLPAITVYTCAHNQERYVRSCMESVMMQNMSNMEYIVIDDCSTDDTPRIMLDWYSSLTEEQRGKVRMVRNSRNIGLPASCNKALKMARGKYVLRVDSDDLLHPLCLSKMEAIAKDNREACSIYAGYWLMDDKGKPIKEVKSNDLHHPGCCLLLKSAAHEIHYKEGVENYEGLEFRERFEKLFGHDHIDEPLWFYRQHDKSKSHLRGEGEA